jgi:peptidylprolyl isomerase
MSQLYKIGIIVAVMLLVLLGLSKLTDKTTEPSPEPETVSNEDVTPPTESKPEDTTNETTMNEQQENTNVVLKTNKGDITIELFTKDSPITAGNFLKLAKDDFYDGVKFHRVIDGFMIQGGDPNSKDDSKKAAWGTGGPGYAIEDEFIKGLSNVRGTIAMANSGPNSGGSQFFINLVDNTNLDFDKQPLTSRHPVFGKVISGMDVVDAIGKVQTGDRDVPVEPVVIKDIEVLE